MLMSRFVSILPKISILSGLGIVPFRRINYVVLCEARGPRPKFPRVYKTRNRIGTISKAQKLVETIKGLSNVKEELYGALDSFVAWELEFPLIVVKKALKTLEVQKEWKRMIQVIKWMLSKGQGKTMGSYFSLLNALVEDGRLEEAEELWSHLFSKYMEALPKVFFMKMISLYYDRGMHDKMFDIFADMEEIGVRPEGTIIKMMGDVFQKLDMMDKYEKLNKKYPPPKWEYRYIKGKRIRIKVKNEEMSPENNNIYDDVSSEAGVNNNNYYEDISPEAVVNNNDEVVSQEAAVNNNNYEVISQGLLNNNNYEDPQAEVSEEQEKLF